MFSFETYNKLCRQYIIVIHKMQPFVTNLTVSEQFCITINKLLHKNKRSKTKAIRRTTKAVKKLGRVVIPKEIRRTIRIREGGLGCRLGRCVLLAEMSAGHPHPVADNIDTIQQVL